MERQNNAASHDSSRSNLFQALHFMRRGTTDGAGKTEFNEEVKLEKTFSITHFDKRSL
jgi:hypothetical protein